MTIESNEYTIERREGSAIRSPEWQTSGITSGSQVMGGTGVFASWSEASTTPVSSDVMVEIINDPEASGISEAILEDDEIRLSIERAREEMKRGAPYLSHHEIFGD